MLWNWSGRAMDETVSGRAVQAIVAALPEFERKHFDISKYDVNVFLYQGEIHVTLLDPNRPTGSYGPLDPTKKSLIQYFVALDPMTLSVRGAGLSK
jgi:hypothetical protein